MEKDELKEICANKLKSISKQVVSDDRKDAMELLQVSYMTVLRYLQGEVKNLDFGVKLYEFLNERIEKRKAVLTA